MRVAQKELGGGIVEAGEDAPVAVVETVGERVADVVLVDLDRGPGSQRHAAASRGALDEVVAERERRAGRRRRRGVVADVGDELRGHLIVDGISALDAEGEHGVRVDAPVGLHARRVAGENREDVGRIVDLQEGARRTRAAAGHRGIVGGAALLVLDILAARTAGDDDPEVAIHGQRVVELEARPNLVDLGVVEERGTVQLRPQRCAGEIDVVVERGALPLECALADEVDGTGERIGRRGGRGHLGDLDARQVVDRHLAEIEETRVAGDVGGVGELRAIGRDRRHGGAEAPHTDARRRGLVARAIVERGDAGQELHHLRHIAVHHVAEGVRRHDELHVRREALLVIRDRHRIGLAGGSHDEGIELHCAARGARGAERDVAFDALAGGNRHRDGERRETRVEDLEDGLARRHVV